MATLDFGIRYETAVLEWFDHLARDVGGAGRRPQGGRRSPAGSTPRTTLRGSIDGSVSAI
jgi:hypothetical protein